MSIVIIGAGPNLGAAIARRCHAALAVRAVQSAINSPDAILQRRLKGHSDSIFSFSHTGTSTASAILTAVIESGTKPSFGVWDWAVTTARRRQRNRWLDGVSLA